MIPFPTDISFKEFLLSLTLLAAFSLGVWSLASYMGIGDNAARIKKEYAQARSLWLSECKADGRRLDDCLRAWEDLRTLQEMYVGRVKP